jgi:hypothetical protein
MQFRFGCVLTLAALVLASPVFAGELVVAPDSGSLRTGDGFTLGTAFTVGSSSAKVTSLGAWDNGSDGLSFAKPVAIWDSGGTMIASATVPAGTAGTLVGEFRYTSITPVTLTAGQQYTAGVYYSAADTDSLHDHTGTPTMSSDFTGYVAVFTGSNTVGSISRPTGGATGAEYIGPSFQYAVPEPASIGTMLLAGSLLVLRRRTAK